MGAYPQTSSRNRVIAAFTRAHSNQRRGHVRSNGGSQRTDVLVRRILPRHDSNLDLIGRERCRSSAPIRLALILVAYSMNKAAWDTHSCTIVEIPLGPVAHRSRPRVVTLAHQFIRNKEFPHVAVDLPLRKPQRTHNPLRVQSQIGGEHITDLGIGGGPSLA